MKLISKYHYIISCIIFIILCSIAIHKLFMGGTIIFGDIDFGFDSSKYIDHLFPVWNDLRNTSNFFNMPRLAFVFPFFKIFYNIGGSGLFERSIFIFTILLAGISNIDLSYHIIKKYIHDQDTNSKLYISLIVGLIAGGLLYAINPYALVRIHHFYLYVGYAIFPLFIKHLLLLYNTNSNTSEENNKYNFEYIINHLKGVFTLSVIFIILSASMHYIVFSFIIIGILGLYNFTNYIFQKKYKDAIFMSISMILLVILFLGVLAYFILPYIQASSIPDFGPKNINTIDTINLFSRFSSLQNIALLKSYRRPMYDYSTLGGTLEIGGWIIVFTMLLGLFTNINNNTAKRILGLTLALIIASSGTYYQSIAPIYSSFVIKNPISQTLGLIFRDPNKIVGIICVIYGLIISWSIFLISQIILDIKSIEIRHSKQLEILKSIAYWLFLGANAIGIYMFLFPVTFDYMNYFYNPIPTPQEYQNIDQKTLQDTSSKSIFLPRYEKEKLPGYDFAVTSRNNNSGDKNIQKPTGSADIYSISAPTYHPLEGNDESINYFYSFLDSYLYNGYGQNIAPILQSTNIKYIYYHQDILGREKIDKIQTKNLSNQLGIKLINQSGFMSTRGIDNAGSKFSYSSGKYIYSFGGVRDWLSCIFTLNKYDYDCKTYIFAKQDINTTINTGESIIVSNKYDYDFNLSKNKTVISLFDFVESSNPRIGRAKTKVMSQDRLYYINYLNIINYVRDFDYNKGAIFSFSPSTFNIPSYKNPIEYGKILFNLKNIEDISQLFIGLNDNESNITLVLDKKSSNDKFTSVKSSLVIGNSQVWRIGSSKFFTAKEYNGYSFKIKISGLHISKLHMKIKYFDDNFHETGIGYISTPELASTYDKIELSDSFISPKGTKFLQVQFYSLENPTKESFWRLHDLEIKDLSEITKPNQANIKTKILTGGIYNIYIRSFYSSRGGIIKYNFDQNIGYINTKKIGNGKFERENIGKINIGTGETLSGYIQNIEGFNAINLLRLQPETESITFKNKQIILQEAELYSEYSGNSQSYKHYPSLSNGKSVNILSGYIKFNFDILEEGKKNININTNKLFTGLADIKVILSGNDTITGLFDGDINKLSDINSYFQKGKYELYIYIKDKYISKINTFDLHTSNLIGPSIKIKKEDSFDTENRKSKYEFEIGDMKNTGITDTYIQNKNNSTTGTKIYEDEEGCSFFYDINSGAYNINYSKNNININFNTGYGCNWLIITNDKVKVKPNNEYIIMFDLDKQRSKKLHTKVKFFDSSGNEIQVSGLDVGDDINGKNPTVSNQMFDLEYGSYGGSYKGHYEGILTTPENAEYMNIERLQKQRQDLLSSININNLIVREYASIAGVDSIFISNSENKNSEDKDQKIIKQNTAYTPLRSISGSNLRPFRVNLFINGYINDGSYTGDNINFEYIPNRKFKLGIYITMFCIISGLATYIISYIKNKKTLANQ